MEQFVIRGGKPLLGSISIKGAKNAFTKEMVASLLTDETVTLHNCPSTLELALTGELLRQVGARVSTLKHGSLSIRAAKLKNHHVNELSRRNRIPILALAPLLHRMGRAEVPYVGGDAIGARPVNFHLGILKKMGASVRIKKYSYEARTKGLRGAVVTLPFPSVGATETAIMAGVLAKGKTVIKNAAGEPEIIDLISFLQKMGALIELDTNRVISIEGVNYLHGAEHRVMPDRLEAVSFAVLALATKGNVLVEDARHDHLITFLTAVRRIGGEYIVEKNGIRFFLKKKIKPLSIETSPHPGFVTDWQQPFAALLMKAKGVSTVHETVYEDRFGYIKDFISMGARINITTKCLGSKCRFANKNYLHSIRIYGPARLHGSSIMVRDIRAGLAHLVAALSANGISYIAGIEHLDRGYENIDLRLRKIGADIHRI